MAGSSFEEAVKAVLSDTLNLPAGFLDYVGIQYPAQNVLPVAKTSGQRLAVDTSTVSNVTATGTTFGTGTDVLATAIEFTATGNNNYIVRLFGNAFSNGTSGDGAQLRVNLDGADGGGMGETISAANSQWVPCVGVGYISRPSPGEHSVNVRLLAVTGGTATMTASSTSPIIVTLEVA